MAKKRKNEREKTKEIKAAGVSKKSSSKKTSTKKVVKPKRQRTEAQKEAARRNAAKARQAKAAYAELRKTGFTRENIKIATDIIQDVLTSTSMRIDTNPVVARLFSEIGSFKSEEELSTMSKAEYFKYATSIRTFLGSPLSSEDAAKYLQNNFRRDMIKDALIMSSGERRESYKARRKAFIASNQQVSAKIFELYRRIMETNAGQVIKAKVNPAAYGSDNLIVDLFDFYESGQWTDFDMDTAVAYWRSIIEEQEIAIQEEARNFGSKEALEIQKFDWRGVYTYASFIQR